MQARYRFSWVLLVGAVFFLCVGILALVTRWGNVDAWFSAVAVVLMIPVIVALIRMKGR